MRRFNLIGLVLLSVCMALPSQTLRAQMRRGGVAAGTASTSTAATLSASTRKAAERITAAQLKDYLYYIASDEMAGRDTPSPGLDATAKFIADKLAKLKFKPAGDKGTYFQTIELRKIEVDQAQTLAELQGRTFKVGTDFITRGKGLGDVTGPLIYVGHGWVVKSKNIDAYEGLDVRGKIVIVSGNGSSPPPGVSLSDMNNAPAGSWESPVSYAQKHGAKALILVPRSFDRTWSSGIRSLARNSYEVVRFGEGDEDEEDDDDADEMAHALPTIVPSREMLDALFQGEAHSGSEILHNTVAGRPFKGFDLAQSKQTRISVNLKFTPATTQNVVAVLEGRDSVLKKEYVAFGAHYDHVGVGREVNGDSIYNGADDDGSGTTALLAMADAFARGPRPRRSLLFVWHAGEERGLWGSRYFTEYPTVPLKNIVTQINIDMIGRSKKQGDANPRNRMLTGPNEIYVIGSRMMSSELGDINERINRAFYNLNFNFHYDEPNDPERLFYRSDHYNYASKGIPIVFFFDGVHEDYHQPSDSPDKIDYQKMEAVTRTVFAIGTEIANAPKRPLVDKPLPGSTIEE